MYLSNILGKKIAYGSYKVLLSNLFFYGVRIVTFYKIEKQSKESLRHFGSGQLPLPSSLLADVALLPSQPLIIVTLVYLCTVWHSHIFFARLGDDMASIHCGSFKIHDHLYVSSILSFPQEAREVNTQILSLSCK